MFIEVGIQDAANQINPLAPGAQSLPMPQLLSILYLSRKPGILNNPENNLRSIGIQYRQHPGPWYRFRVHLSRPRNAYGYVLLIPTTCGLRHYLAREALFHRPMDCNPDLL